MSVVPPFTTPGRSPFARRIPDQRECVVIGDVHGCADELHLLLDEIPSDRFLVFVGDLVARGPDSAGVLVRVLDLVDRGRAIVTRGNHDDDLARVLSSPGYTGSHLTSARQVSRHVDVADRFLRSFATWPFQVILDEDSLVVVHGGVRGHSVGLDTPAARRLAVNGDEPGGHDANGFRRRLDWAADYDGSPRVVYGHTPVRDVSWRNRTLAIDQGCVYGGALSALIWPEGEIVQVSSFQHPPGLSPLDHRQPA